MTFTTPPAAPSVAALAATAIGSTTAADAATGNPIQFIWSTLANIKAEGNTVTADVARFEPTIFKWMYFLTGYVMPKAYYEKVGAEGFEAAPIGTGPYMVDKFERNAFVRLKANANYWGGKPKLGKVIFKVVKENSVRADELIAGTVHIIDGVDPNDMERLKKADGVKFMSAPGMNINYLAFRTNRPPFDNVKLRQAVSMAVGKVGMVDALYRGIGVSANGPLPPGLVGYDSSLKPIGYDPDGAKKILQELGYSTK